MGLCLIQRNSGNLRKEPRAVLSTDNPHWHPTSNLLPDLFTQFPSPNAFPNLEAGGDPAMHLAGPDQNNAIQESSPPSECLASSQNDDPFRSPATSSINCFYSSGLATEPEAVSPWITVLPKLQGIQESTPRRIPEHCQMADSHHASRVALEECDYAPFVWLPPHSLAGPHSPTAHSHSKALSVNHSQPHHHTTENPTTASSPLEVARLSSPIVKLLKQRS